MLFLKKEFLRVCVEWGRHNRDSPVLVTVQVVCELSLGCRHVSILVNLGTVSLSLLTSSPVALAPVTPFLPGTATSETKCVHVTPLKGCALGQEGTCTDSPGPSALAL